MNIEQIKKWIGTGNFKDAENAWMNAIEDSPAPDKVWQVLESLVAADKAEMAETLGWAMLDAHADAPKDQTLALARAALLAVPESQELRSQTVELYKAVHGSDGNFEKLWKSAGLDGGQSPKRAIRTLDTCLAIQPDKYMANRFDGRVIRITQLNALGEYEFTDAGLSESLEPKLLADEFDLLPETDFRVLSRKDPDALAEMFKKQLDKVLIGLCESHGGSVDTDQIKKVILGKFVPKDKWTSWWGRARTAVKKCGNLVLEGRNPVTVVYHPGGQSLEEELAEQLEEAYSPKEYLGVLRNYMREIAHRGLTADAEFTRPIMNALAARAVQWAQSRPGDAMEAVGAIAIGEKLGAAPPEKEYPTASAILAEADKPAETIADLDDAALWPIAMAALAERDDAAGRFGELFSLAPAGQLDTIAAKLAELGNGDVPAETITKAMNDSLGYIEVLLWVWNAPKLPTDEPPAKLNVLAKLLQTLHDIDHKSEAGREWKKAARQRIRSALAVRNFASYRAAVAEMNESMASVIKGKIERSDGLALAIRDKMLDSLKENFYSLFIEKKKDPWLDENIIWTTQAAMDARTEEMRVLTEEAMPANAKQIGEAAEEGDLRENADWQAAIEERDMLVARARKMNNELTIARVLKLSDVLDDTVSVGSLVRLKRASDGEEIEMSFLGPWDSDPQKRIYAYTTRLAQSLMGKSLGMTFELEIEGRPDKYTIQILTPSDGLE